MAADGPDDPVLVAHPRGGRAAGRLGAGRLRRAAGGGRRLPVDPPADDRPAAHVHGPLVRRPAAGRGADGRRVGVRGGAGGRPRRDPDRRLRRLHPGPAAGRPDARGSRCSRSARPTTRSRASSATWSADERRWRRSSRSRCAACSAVAGRSCSSCWSALPVAHRAARPRQRRAPGRRPASSTRSSSGPCMPLVALILGTAALGSEIDDGTAVYLLIKPIPRWRIALAKILVAAGLTARPRRPGGRADRCCSLGSRHRHGDDASSASRIACLVGGSRLRRRVRRPQRVHVPGAPPRPRLRADLGGRRCPACSRAPGSCRSARRRSASAAALGVDTARASRSTPIVSRRRCSRSSSSARC